MKRLQFRGGVHPDDHKAPTAECPIEELALPARLFVPMQQHIGAPAEPCVRIGQKLLKGELIGRAQGAISAPVHAPTSGTVLSVEECTAPHPSGLPVLSVVIEPDGRDEWRDFPVPRNPLEMPPETIAERVAAAGIVGMGGATFPTAVKLGGAIGKHIHTLVINGGECEPYLTCDDRLMRERPAEIVEGAQIMLQGIRWGRAIIAIEENKPQALAAMQEATRGLGNIEVRAVPARYPMGSEKQLIGLLTGLEVPAGGLTAAVGVLVQNVATAYAVHEAIRYGRPLVSRVVTVGGGAVARPKNLRVPIGARASDLLAACGGLTEAPARLLMGGPMMGMPMPSDTVPMVKGSSGLLALTPAEARPAQPPSPCIRCARCVRACPMGLMPLEMAARARRGDVEGAEAWGLKDCILCGSCSYTCPARIPLVHYFLYARGELGLREAQKRKSEHTRRLAESRALRLEREARQKAEAAARRKAERAAKKAAEAAANCTESAP